MSSDSGTRHCSCEFDKNTSLSGIMLPVAECGYHQRLREERESLVKFRDDFSLASVRMAQLEHDLAAARAEIAAKDALSDHWKRTARIAHNNATTYLSHAERAEAERDALKQLSKHGDHTIAVYIETTKQLRAEVERLRGELTRLVTLKVENDRLREENDKLADAAVSPCAGCDGCPPPKRCPMNECLIAHNLRAENARWEQVWTALNEMGAELGGANKPLAVTVSWTLKKREVERLRGELRESRVKVLWECYELAEDERIKWGDEASDLGYERAHEAECLRDRIKQEIDKHAAPEPQPECPICHGKGATNAVCDGCASTRFWEQPESEVGP